VTVIASYNHFGCGIVIGDILINGPVDEKKLPETVLPTLGNVKDFFGGAWGIHQSAQKVCIISDLCAISWAGSLIYARSFVERLTRFSRRININSEIIKHLFEKYGEGNIEIAGAVDIAMEKSKLLDSAARKLNARLSALSIAGARERQ
jgi:hypothetical protein